MNKENNKKITDYLTEREIKILKRFSELQLDVLSEDINENINLISFDYHGMNIVNPFVDDCGCYDVDPVEYYGELFLDSDFIKLFD